MAISSDLSHCDLDFRRPVWEALSELYLDTDTTLFEKQIVQTLAASPYSVPEIKSILIYEVHPVCVWNAFAWVWEGFDTVWLETKILSKKGLLSNLFSYLLSFVAKLVLDRSSQWNRIKKEIVEKRDMLKTSESLKQG